MLLRAVDDANGAVPTGCREPLLLARRVLRGALLGSVHMSTLKEFLCLLCTQPEMSDRRIAVTTGRSPGTVRRYRRALRAKQWSWHDLEDLTATQLNDRFNQPRYRPPKKTAFDMGRVDAIMDEPGATMRDAWEDYRARYPRPHLSLSSFRARIGKRWRHSFIRVADADDIRENTVSAASEGSVAASPGENKIDV